MLKVVLVCNVLAFSVGQPSCTSWKQSANATTLPEIECGRPSGMVDYEACSGYASAGVVPIDKCGGEGTPCYVASKAIGTIDSIYTANLVDVIIEYVSICPTCVLFFAPGPSSVVQALFFLADGIAQILAIIQSFNVDVDGIEKLMNSNCTNTEGTATLAEFKSEIENIRLLGIIELSIAGIGAFLDFYTAANTILGDKDGAELGDLFVECLQVMTAVLDLVLSNVEFFWLSVDARDKTKKYFESLHGEIGDSQIRSCVSKVTPIPDGCVIPPGVGSSDNSSVQWWVVLLAVLGSCCLLFCCAAAAGGAKKAKKKPVKKLSRPPLSPGTRPGTLYSDEEDEDDYYDEEE